MVYRYTYLIEPPGFGQHRRRQSVLDTYIPYILRRWEKGCRDRRKLFQEIQERGYSYSAHPRTCSSTFRNSTIVTSNRSRVYGRKRTVEGAYVLRDW